MNPFALSGWLVCLTSLAMGGFALAKDPASPLTRRWAIFTLSVAAWGGGVAWIAQDRDPETALLAWRITYVLGVVWITPLFHHFTLVFCALQHDSKQRRILLAQYVIATLFLPLILFSPWVIAGVRPVFSAAFYYNVAGPVFYPYFIWWTGLVLYSHNLIFQSYRRESGLKRRQLRYVLAAFVLSYSTGALCYLPAFGIDVYPYGNFGIAVYPVIITYAMGAHRLMGIRTVVHKTIAWAALSSLVVLPSIGLFLLSHEWMRAVSPFVQALWVGGIVLVLVPYMRIVQPYVDHLFQRRKNDLQRTLKDLAHELVYLKTFDAAIQQITHAIRGALYVSDITVFVRNGNTNPFRRIGEGGKAGSEMLVNQALPDESALSWIKNVGGICVMDELARCADATLRDSAQSYFKKCGPKVVLPFLHDGEIICLIHLGDKGNLKPFSEMDCEFLSALVDGSTIALRNALLYDDVRELTHELRQWTLELEQRIETRTQDLVANNQALDHAFQKLKEYDEMKDTFFSNVNHEMRTPLTMIMAPIDMLANRSLGPLTLEQERYLKVMQGQARRLLNLVNNILYIAKMDGGGMGIFYKKADLPRFVSEIANAFVLLAEEKSLVLRFEKRGNLPEFYFDLDKIERVVVNLIFNAIKFTHQGGVTVSCAPHEEGALVQVTDTGDGIQKAHLPNLFRRYFTGSRTGGTGIGLSLVKALVDAHKGRVWVETEEGKGTTFSFVLPILDHIPETVQVGGARLSEDRRHRLRTMPSFQPTR